ncbi:hypothetical protein AMRN_0890 [Malaciobacter marinus]|uniref:Uncharacterized protein n=1 Tax=Malaciobacter marinus TaxID=505249 RepID=A0A347TJ64_9BACT|nr:glycosyltransferase [Malaciobacter marinus]AXX86642.1 hypothetical protein AMRN_0890 [Malaciobacter marinus]PHO14687.1 hypothetical protein CPH92_10445 [Malaciobacter marinus]
MEDKYILQFGSLAGWPYKIAKELRNRSINSKNVIYLDSEWKDLNRRLKFDRALYKKSDNIFIKIYNLLKYLHDVPKEVSLVHYHSSNIFFRELHWLYEGRLYKKHNIPMIITFGGGDVREIKLANELNEHFFLKNSFSTFIRDIKTKIRFWSWSKRLDYVVTDPEFIDYAKPYFKKVFLFRQPVDLSLIDCIYPDENNDIPRILHIPTEPIVKGTVYIKEAVKRLEEEGYKFEFVLKRQITQEEMYKEITNCDIYVDELRCGSHGVTAVETMAAGKPTITYIRDDLKSKFPPELPLVIANPDTIYDVLKGLILDSKKRYEIGKNSRTYVEKYHDVKVVVDDLLKIYEEISNK